MRIISGKWRGQKLAQLGAGDMDAHLRPTTDRVRESLFNLLTGGAYGNPITGARVLDLFAGTGALALEALSRGADCAHLVDDGRVAQGLIRANIAACKAQDSARLIRRDARDLGPCEDAPFDLIFLDPPYGMGLGEAALTSAFAGGWIAQDALIIWEEATRPRLPAQLRLLDQRSYGSSLITLARVT